MTILIISFDLNYWLDFLACTASLYTYKEVIEVVPTPLEENVMT
jgi:hypothetical protein